MERGKEEKARSILEIDLYGYLEDLKQEIPARGRGHKKSLSKAARRGVSLFCVPKFTRKRTFSRGCEPDYGEKVVGGDRRQFLRWVATNLKRSYKRRHVLNESSDLRAAWNPKCRKRGRGEKIGVSQKKNLDNGGKNSGNDRNGEFKRARR